MQDIVAAVDGSVKAAIFEQLARHELQAIFSVGVLGNFLQESHLSARTCQVSSSLAHAPGKGGPASLSFRRWGRVQCHELYNQASHLASEGFEQQAGRQDVAAAVLVLVTGLQQLLHAMRGYKTCSIAYLVHRG